MVSTGATVEADRPARRRKHVCEICIVLVDDACLFGARDWAFLYYFSVANPNKMCNTHAHLRLSIPLAVYYFLYEPCCLSWTNNWMINWFMFILFWFHAANHCRPPPLVNNAAATLDPSGRSVNITCFIGHRFPDGVSYKVLHCHPDGQWDHIPNCDGTSTLIIKITKGMHDYCLCPLQLCIQYIVIPCPLLCSVDTYKSIVWWLFLRPDRWYSLAAQFRKHDSRSNLSRMERIRRLTYRPADRQQYSCHSQKFTNWSACLSSMCVANLHHNEHVSHVWLKNGKICFVLLHFVLLSHLSVIFNSSWHESDDKLTVDTMKVRHVVREN